MGRDPYIAIMVAAANGVGVRLTAEECHQLSFDDAIATRANNGLSKDEWGSGWKKISPRKARIAANLSSYDPHSSHIPPPPGETK